MTRGPLSDPTMRIAALAGPLEQYFSRVLQVREQDPDMADFAAGNPQEMAFDAYVDALRRWSVPEDGQWFAYKMSEPPAQKVVAESLRDYLGIAFEPDDVALTNAAIAALAVTLRTICQEGDEVIIIQPPHFLYEPLILAAGATAVRVPVVEGTFDLDVDAIARAITPNTRAVIVNTPHNPTGRIFPPEQLDALAKVLTEASERHQPIYLLSDEAYHKILFDDHTFHSPVAFYPRSFLIYSYGKILLAPGERIGFIAMPPDNPDRDVLRVGLIVNQLTTGYAFPNAVLQHGLGDLDRLTIDLKHLQAKRDLMVDQLRRIGYELHVPEATFYLLPRSPLEDDVAFFELLLEEHILAMPGRMLESPGHFRLSLSASDEMIERSIPGFERAFQRAN